MAEMKAVVLGISPSATIVDITHQVEKFNVRMGAYVLAAASPYFPKGTVHVVVVDPGVGTERQPIIVQTKKCCFVGPDNGVLALAAKSIGGEMHVHRITNREFMLPKCPARFMRETSSCQQQLTLSMVDALLNSDQRFIK